MNVKICIVVLVVLAAITACTFPLFDSEQVALETQVSAISTKVAEDIAELQRENRNLNFHIAEQQDEISNLENEVEYLREGVEMRDQKIKDLEAELNSRDLEINSLKVLLSERDAEISDLEEQIDDLVEFQNGAAEARKILDIVGRVLSDSLKGFWNVAEPYWDEIKETVVEEYEKSR